MFARLRLENLMYWAINGGVKVDEETKACFGEQCKGCKDFYGCTEHFPYGCWGEE